MLIRVMQLRGNIAKNYFYFEVSIALIIDLTLISKSKLSQFLLNSNKNNQILLV